MSQKIIIGVLAAIIIIGGGAWFYTKTASDEGGWSMGGKGGEERSEATGKDDGDTKDAKDKNDNGLLGDFTDLFSGKISDLVAKGKPIECKFTATDPYSNEPASGVTYISDDNFIVIADTVMEGHELELHMIQKKEGILYAWSDNDEVLPPMKFDMSMFQDMADQMGSDEQVGAESPMDWLDDPKAKAQYKCRSWSPRSNSFEPPKDLKFIDPFGQMFNMMGAMPMGEDMANDPYGGADTDYGSGEAY